MPGSKRRSAGPSAKTTFPSSPASPAPTDRRARAAGRPSDTRVARRASTGLPHRPACGPLPRGLAGAGGAGAGLAATLLTKLLYACEDLFARLPVHRMWGPAIGGLAVGLGGLVEPPALGVGYDVIADLPGAHPLAGAVALVLVAKAAIWRVALSSGTSGGVLAPLLILGGVLAPLLILGGAFGWLLGLGRLVGIVTRRDLLQVRAAVVRGERERSRALGALAPRRRAAASPPA